jgi:hypothetical protein
MAARVYCHVCRGTNLAFENGVLVCETCGAQTQVRVRVHVRASARQAVVGLHAVEHSTHMHHHPHARRTHNTQTYQEEAEYQQGIDDARGRRRAAGQTAGAAAQSQAALLAREEAQAAKQFQDAALTYCRALQHLLRVRGVDAWRGVCLRQQA